MKVHLIAIGGAVMHNMALALKEQGHAVSGSDDEIRDPSRSRLDKAGLLPESYGWLASRITKDLDAVILGMHAREDNPELLKTQELGIPLYSFPEFVYEKSKTKTRVVIAGSHGKTTTTSMVMHALKKGGLDFDYLVGAQLEGFKTMVRLSDAPIIVIEGDEYLSSPLDRRPKFLHYKANVLLITGIAWDHINVFPSFENYLDQFRALLTDTSKSAKVYWYEQDDHLEDIVEAYKAKFKEIKSYTSLQSSNNGSQTIVRHGGNNFELSVFGEHNLANICGAMNLCEALGISRQDFLSYMVDFKGASLRMESLLDQKDRSIYRDFAHAPSKVKASLKAFAELHPKRKTIAILELHTFSSLNKKFLGQYKESLDPADIALVFYSPKTIEHKKLEPINEDEVRAAFAKAKLMVITDTNELKEQLYKLNLAQSDLILMSSGSFEGLNISSLVNHHRAKE